MDEHVAGIPSGSGVSAFDLDLRYDQNLVDISVDEGGFLSGTGRAINCDITVLNFFERVFSCTSTGAAPLPTHSVSWYANISSADLDTTD